MNETRMCRAPGCDEEIPGRFKFCKGHKNECRKCCARCEKKICSVCWPTLCISCERVKPEAERHRAMCSWCWRSSTWKTCANPGCAERHGKPEPNQTPLTPYCKGCRHP